jgi:hypothetical protein
VPTLGDTTKPTYSFQGYDGSSFPNQMAERYTAPQKIKINALGSWLAGWNQASQVRLCVWAADGTLLGQTAEFTIANEGAPADGNVTLYEEDLVSPVTIDAGDQFYVGTSRDRDDAVVWGTGSNAYTRYEASGAYPAGNFGAIEAAVAKTRRIGQYVADYEPVAGAWGFRGGVWVQAEFVKGRRGGAWVDATSVQGRRGAGWEDAQ